MRDKKRKSQAIPEYFLLLSVIAILTVMGVTTLLPKISTAGEDFANDAINKMTGKVEEVPVSIFPLDFRNFAISPNPVFRGRDEFATFYHLMQNTTIKIYTMDARLIFSATPTLTKPEWQWNLKVNIEGSGLVSSGTYFCQVSASGNSRTEKLIVY